MDYPGEQLHPNWRALATVHIPLKRFIKEGANEVESGTHLTHEKYKISHVKGDDIKRFYEELVTTTNKEKSETVIKRTQMIGNKNKQQLKPFDVRNYFRFAMENKVNKLNNMNFQDQNVNVCDSYGRSALMMASCEGAYEAVHFLLTLGVDKNISDNSGRTAKDLAYCKGHHDIVKLLENNHRDLGENNVEEEEEKCEPFYCEICKQHYKETSKSQHYTSTVHQFNTKSNLPHNKLQKFNISSGNKGLQLMVKQGWDKESGLGSSQSGRLYPIKTVIRKKRTGLGIEQDSARITHFQAYDLAAVKRHCSEYYKKKSRNRNDIKREKIREWKRDKRLRNELN